MFRTERFMNTVIDVGTFERESETVRTLDQWQETPVLVLIKKAQR